MKTFNKILLLFFLVVLSPFNFLTANESAEIEFNFTENELQEIGKWKNKTAEDMLGDAFKGERAALYMIGMSLLTGKTGLTIDVDIADFYFSTSGSLGFAPSIKQMVYKSVEEENIFLIMVYCNLLTSFGHSEYVMTYLEQRSKIVSNFGEGVAREIEKIAARKLKLIESNRENLKKSPDKDKFILEMSYKNMLINKNDKDLNNAYWYHFSKFQDESKDEAIKFELAIQQNYPEFQRYYEISQKNVQKTIKNLNNDEKIPAEFQQEALKDIKKAIRKTSDFEETLDDFKNSSNPKICKITKEFLSLCKSVKCVLDQRYQFLLSPEKYLSSEDSISKFRDSIATANDQFENIKEIFMKLDDGDEHRESYPKDTDL